MKKIPPMPHFYSLTLQKASCINQAVYGNFSLPKAQEIVVSRYVHLFCFCACENRGTLLELLRPDDHGNMHVVCSHEVFGLIRSMVTCRLVGAKRDYLVVGSDSGRIVILDFDVKLNLFVKVHQETYGRSGCRRIVPGEYLAMDPSGRACMIGAIEKQKFVYVLNRDLHHKLTISSPLEAHKSGTLVYALTALDVGFENPLFASLEQDISQPDRPVQYTIYEMDLGVNHVSRKFAEPVPDSSHMLIPFQGGCLICTSGHLLYKKLGQPTLKAILPRRADSPNPATVVAHASHKFKDEIFVLIQSDTGDLFRVQIDAGEIQISYFETLPFRAVSLCILKTGFLFAAAEFGDHVLYQFDSNFLSLKNIVETFLPKQMSALSIISTMPSLSPLIDMKAMDPLVETASGGACQIFSLCNRTLRVLRQGLGVSEMAVSELPGKPSGLWTIPHSTEARTEYIVISFIDVTLVLAIGESVEEVSDSGFLSSIPSLFCARVEQGLLQIHPGGVRFVGQQVSEWRAPVIMGTAKNSEIILGLENGDFVFLQISNGLLIEKGRRNFGAQICSLAIDSNFAAVAGIDRAVRIISLEPGVKFLKQVSAQSYAVLATSVAISDNWVYIGLENGTLVRCCLDSVTGGLSDARMRYLGSRPVRLQTVGSSVLALSSRPWWVTAESPPRVISYLETETQLPVVLELGAAFASPDGAGGIVAVSQTTLRIIGLDSGTTNQFCQQEISLAYTPKKLVLLPQTSSSENLFVNDNSMLAVLQSGINTYSDKARVGLIEALAQPDADDAKIGRLVDNPNCWGSCVQIIDPVSLATKFKIEYDNNECAVALGVVYFYQLKDNRPCLVVGVSRNLELEPVRSAELNWLKTYLYDKNFVLQLVHSTAIEAPVSALCHYEGRLLVSSTIDAIATLRLYELGKKKILRKTEYRNSQCGAFVALQVVNDRIFAADVFNSVHVIKLNKSDGQFFVVCDDTVPRYISAMHVVDYNTVVGGDKFDGFFALTVPPEVKDEQSTTGESSAIRLGPDTAYVLGKTKKFDPTNSFHLGQTITAMQKVTMSAGSSEVILYSTLGGSIGAMCPITSRKEYNLLLALETELRDNTTLVGRDHLAFRSFYLPSKGVVDGDLIAQEFKRSNRKTEIAQKLGKTENEINKIIEEMLYRIT